MRIGPNARPRHMASAEQVPAQSRSEAREQVSYRWLIDTGHDAQKRGDVLILMYAGRREPDARSVALRHTSGKAAKRSQTLIRRDMRHATSDQAYNAVIDAVLAEIHAEEEVEYAPEQPIDIVEFSVEQVGHLANGTALTPTREMSIEEAQALFGGLGFAEPLFGGMGHLRLEQIREQLRRRAEKIAGIPIAKLEGQS